MDLLSNKVLVTAVICWFVAQFIKVIIDYLLEGRLDLARIHGSGGMPSSHSATICGISCAIGFAEGASSSLFALSVIMAIIVMHDASNVRKSVGDHAKLLNQQFTELIQNGMNQKLFKELIGHKPVEVVAGAILGIVTSLLLYLFVW
ncbi:MAG: divergent PAP2 family protein [Bacillota bacterium]|nr:divergent PAP2 family protein [Bacillota bacterium]